MDSPATVIQVEKTTRKRSLANVIAAIMLFALVVTIQLWIATAGTFSLQIVESEFMYTTTFYTKLADAFAHGQLHLRINPPPGLAELSDPYDPVARRGLYAMHDVLYYAGRYYLGRGPTPAILLAIVQVATGLRDIPDSYLVVAFVFGMTLSGGLVIWQLWRLLFSQERGWLPAVAFLVLGLGNPTLFILARPAAYEASIAAGQCFLLLGLLFALSGLFRERAKPWLWLAAGGNWALALGSRYTLAPAIGLFLLIFAFWAYRLVCSRSARYALTQVALLLALPAAVVFLLGLYNQIRFGSWLETGLRYVLTDTNRNREWETFFSTVYLIPNLFNYLLRPFQLTLEFPFVTWAPLGQASLPGWWPEASIHQSFEPIVGTLYSTPFVSLGLGCLAVLVRRERSVPQYSNGRTEAKWLVPLLALAGGLAALPILLWHRVSMRYLADFTPLLVVLAFVGCGALRASLDRWRLGFGMMVCLLASGSVLLGLLLGLSGYFEHLKRHNPALFAAFVRRIPIGRKADWRGVASYLARTARDGDVVLVAQWPVDLSYYLERENNDLLILDALNLENRLVEGTPDLARPADAWWILFDWNPWSAQDLASVLAQDFTVDTSLFQLAIIHHEHVTSRDELLLYSADVLTAVALVKPEYPFRPFYQAAGLYTAVGLEELAINMKEMEVQGPPSFDASLRIAGYYRGQEAIEKAARWYAVAAERMAPWASVANAALGRMYHEEGLLEEALQAYQQAVTQPEDPETLTYYHEMAQIYEEMERLDDAVQAYQAALGVQPDHPLPHLKLGEYYMESGNTEGALHEFERTVELEGIGSLAFQAAMHLGGYYRSQGEIEKAATWYTTAAEVMAPWASMAHSALGRMYHQEGRLEEALQAYGQAITQPEDPEIATYYLEMTQIYEEMGRLEDAMYAYQALLNLRPDNATARERLRTLEMQDQVALSLPLLEFKGYPEELQEIATAHVAATGDFLMGWNGTVSSPPELLNPGAYILQVEAHGQPALGENPEMPVEVSITGNEGERRVIAMDVFSVGEQTSVYSSSPFELATQTTVVVSISFSNDYGAPDGDRNLFIRRVWIAYEPSD